VRLCCASAVGMATPVPIAIPTEPIGSIPGPLDLIERVAKGDSEDPNLAPLYEDAIRDTIELFEAIGLRSLRTAKEEVSKFLHVLRAWASEHGPGWFHNSVLGRSYAPRVAARTRRFPLQAVRRLLPGCRDALRARADRPPY
jgi:hypothetical protein